MKKENEKIKISEYLEESLGSSVDFRDPDNEECIV
jgi:hypothetical protein